VFKEIRGIDVNKELKQEDTVKLKTEDGQTIEISRKSLDWLKKLK